MFNRSGIAVLCLAAVAVLFGIVAGYPELVGLGAGCAVPPLVARAGSRRAGTFSVSRLLSPERVEVGEPARSVLTVRNDGRRRTRRLHASETIGDGKATVDLPALAPGESTPPLSLTLPTARRGIHPVGPLRFGRPDPFGFTAGLETHASAAWLTVCPRTHALKPLGAGATRDLDGPTSDLAREGGVAFHGLRNYVPGDDVRLIDWRATARSAGNDLFVRQHVETVRPNLDVLVDTDHRRYDADAFELAMEVAASVVSSSIDALHPVTLRTTSVDIDSVLIDLERAGRPLEALLDGLAALQPGGPASLAAAVASLTVAETGHSLVVVTGDVDDEELLSAADHAGRFGRFVVIRAVPTARRTEVDTLGRIITLTVLNGEEFASLWNEQFG